MLTHKLVSHDDILRNFSILFLLTMIKDHCKTQPTVPPCGFYSFATLRFNTQSKEKERDHLTAQSATTHTRVFRVATLVGQGARELGAGSSTEHSRASEAPRLSFLLRPWKESKEEAERGRRKHQASSLLLLLGR